MGSPPAGPQRSEFAMAPTVRHACLSDRGLTHADNEDRWLADPDLGLYAVADGMADARPSQVTVDLLPRLVRHRFGTVPGLGDARAAAALRAVVTEVSERVRDLGCGGSTLVLALVRGPQALLAHLGDSRIYLLRGGQLRQLTSDHSFVQEMVYQGMMSVEEARRRRSNGGPTRFVGMNGEAVADIGPLDLRPGDRLLLCSDGLTGMLDDDRLRSALVAGPAPADVCRRLVAEANAAGGHDNITALVLDYLGSS